MLLGKAEGTSQRSVEGLRRMWILINCIVFRTVVAHLCARVDKGGATILKEGTKSFRSQNLQKVF